MADLSPAALVAYVTAAISVLVLIASSVPKLLGPIGAAVSDWTSRRRRAQHAATEADVDELRGQIDVLRGALADLRGKARDHAAWDRQVYAVLVREGIDIGLPPDLF
jgi:hypothetical protein